MSPAEEGIGTSVAHLLTIKAKAGETQRHGITEESSDAECSQIARRIPRLTS
jgi:hypothetical protein